MKSNSAIVAPLTIYDSLYFLLSQACIASSLIFTITVISTGICTATLQFSASGPTSHQDSQQVHPKKKFHRFLQWDREFIRIQWCFRFITLSRLDRIYNTTVHFFHKVYNTYVSSVIRQFNNICVKMYATLRLVTDRSMEALLCQQTNNAEAIVQYQGVELSSRVICDRYAWFL